MPRKHDIVVRALCGRHRDTAVRLRGRHRAGTDLDGAGVRGQRPRRALRAQLGWGVFDGGASDSLELDRRVARLRQLGGDVTVSFGGAANSELSIGCTDPAELTAAYTVGRRPLLADHDRPGHRGLGGLDARGERTAGPGHRHDDDAAAAGGQPVSVWLTLPVGSSGLTAEGQGVLTSMLAAGVSPGRGQRDDDGLRGTATGRTQHGRPGRTGVDRTAGSRSRTAYQAVGTDLSDAESWHLVGATPMIGQNDIPDEVFGLDDAQQLVAFAAAASARPTVDVVGQPGQVLRSQLSGREGGVGCLQRHRPDARRVRLILFATFSSGAPAPATSTAPDASASTAPSSTVAGDRGRRSWTTPQPRRTRSGTSTRPIPRAPRSSGTSNVYQAKWYTHRRSARPARGDRRSDPVDADRAGAAG